MDVHAAREPLLGKVPFPARLLLRLPAFLLVTHPEPDYTSHICAWLCRPYP